mmetsp:Transcript_13897/g.28338  ORF Transcript_13897/g.28338 Transcript_13897/m.28338 type:complete len:96 (+) Transcript_13897:1686-1973(+)
MYCTQSHPHSIKQEQQRKQDYNTLAFMTDRPEPACRSHKVDKPKSSSTIYTTIIKSNSKHDVIKSIPPPSLRIGSIRWQSTQRQERSQNTHHRWR